MKKCNLRGIAFAAIAGFVLAAHAQDAIDQSQFPTITQQPVDACLPVGANATFSVQATNADGYQWYRNNVVIDGQTNSSLTIPNLGISDVAYYSALVFKGSESVPTRSANLNVYVQSQSTTTTSSSTLTSSSTMTSSSMLSLSDSSGGGSLVVYASPIFSPGGSGTCPGKYSGYVSYTKTTTDGWGWAPSTNTTVHTATDTNRTDTKLQYGGEYGDSGCAQTTVTVPNPPMSPAYRFTIYFPTNTLVPTNPYPITLSGFDP